MRTGIHASILNSICYYVHIRMWYFGGTTIARVPPGDFEGTK